MTTWFFSAVIANIPEALIWVALAIGWVIIQAIVKNTRKPENKPAPPGGQPEPDLEDFFDQLVSRAGKSHETVSETPAPRAAPSRPARAKPEQPKRAVHRGPAVTTAEHRRRAQAIKPPPLGIQAEAPAGTKPYSPFKSVATEREALRVPKWLRSRGDAESWRRAVVYREVMGPPKALQAPLSDLLSG